MQIDDKLIEYLEDLCFLALSDDEKRHLAKDLRETLAGMAVLTELNAENIEACSLPFSNTNAFREDEVTASFDRNLILQNAPEKTDDMFIAPRTVE